MELVDNKDAKRKMIPVNLLAYLYLTPVVSIILLFFGLKYQIIHPLYLWISLFTIIMILIFLPFLKKKKRFVRHLFLGLNLFSMILLISPAIELPLLFAVPVLPVLKVFLALMLIYYAYFFMAFLTDIEIQDYFNILSKDAKLTRDEKIAKTKKWRKMFIISLISVIAIFMSTGIFMVGKTRINLQKIDTVEMKTYLEKMKKLLNITLPVKNVKTINTEINGEIYKVLEGVQIERIGNRIALYETINNKKELLNSIEYRPNYPYLSIFIKQIILSRYMTFAKNGENVISAQYFYNKKLKLYLTHIQSSNYNEIIIVQRKKDKIFINYFNLKNNSKLKNLIYIQINYI